MRPGPKRKYQRLNCGYCGIAYYPDHGDRPSRYCSKKCQGQGQIVARVALTCLYCGREFERRQSEAIAAKFCSYSCKAYGLYVGKTIGVRLHSDRPSKNRGSYWKRQAYRARLRDGYKCQDCGLQFERGTKLLHVHHKIPRRLYGSDHLDNLISLCGKCHRRADAAIQLRELRDWPLGAPRPKHIRRAPLPNYCKNGHEYTAENTMKRNDNNGRRCRICDNASHRRRYHERRRSAQISLLAA
jgi:hypothetical protein